MRALFSLWMALDRQPGDLLSVEDWRCGHVSPAGGAFARIRNPVFAKLLRRSDAFMPQRSGVKV